MNFFEEQFDLLNLFQVVDTPPPRMEDILSSSTIDQSTDKISNQPRFNNKACENKHRASVFRSINLMQPKPKFVFIPTPFYTPPATKVASQNDANNMTTTRSTIDRSVSRKHLMVGSKSTCLNTMPEIEPKTGPLISWFNPEIEPKTERACDFLKYNALWNSAPLDTMKQKRPKIEPGYNFRDNTTPWNSVPVLNLKQKQPKIEPAYSMIEYNTRPWNSVQVEDVKKKQPKMELIPAHDFRFNASSTSTVTSVQLYNHRCTICSKAFPSPQSLGGHMSAHVRKINKRAPNNETKKHCKREYINI
ncbi:hypothetical protein FCM35_KLT18895 [Carex littledalei]|uniref:C2H2-type domain-containing protein n=1 Tax=Carex littledalei TaxID=544730 RepID=A0A833R6V8_9POAL|nr:hypothetical protein FCM35_KLT18895 [Carex littledalei]